MSKAEEKTRRLVTSFFCGTLNETEQSELECLLSQDSFSQKLFEEEMRGLDVYRTATTAFTEVTVHADARGDSCQTLALENLARGLFSGSSTPELLGSIRNFDLTDVIGSGGMGIVYKAFDRELHRYVAIKILSPSLCASGVAKQRFIREAQAAASLTSPYVVPIHSVSTIKDIPYFVMAYVPGQDLQAHLNQHGALSIVDTLKIAYQVAEGLSAAHRQSIVHRDVKPGNVLLEASTMRATLTDFGLARVVDNAHVTHSGMIPGTPSFMSPEQASGGLVGEASDWFSLGSVLHAMLTGSPPFCGTSAFSILQKVVAQPNPSLIQDCKDCPEWLESLRDWLLEKDPARRLKGNLAVEVLHQSLLHLEEPSKNPLPIALEKRIILESELRSNGKNTRQVSITRLIVWLSSLALLLGGAFWLAGIDGSSQNPRSTSAPDEPSSTQPTLSETIFPELSPVEDVSWEDERATISEIEAIQLRLDELENEKEPNP